VEDRAKLRHVPSVPELRGDGAYQGHERGTVMNLLAAIAASIAVSVVSLIGIVALFLKDKVLKSLLLLLIGLSAGGLIGSAFLHILPEAVSNTQSHSVVFINVILGFVFFFFVEHYLHWRHCHQKQCEIHSFAYLNLAGDAVHNFVDGIIIGTSFIVSIPFGIAATMAILLHEIPQEIGDFGVLVYGGFSKGKALLFNFFTAIICVAGTVLGYLLAGRIAGLPGIVLPMAAGGFIYIASCDLIPEIHRQPDVRKAVVSILMFLVGIGLMYGLTFVEM
jgi:zinc and cadmium transporter